MVKEKKKGPRRVKLVCSNCGQARFMKASDVDRGECHFLCKVCDEAYFRWTMRSTTNIFVDDFLKSYAAKQCKLLMKVGR